MFTFLVSLTIRSYCIHFRILTLTMAFDFSNKRILITGAGRGIGKGLAIAIVKAGGEVYALSKNTANLDALVAECGGKSIHTVTVDLADWKGTRKALESLEPMDGLVNNAGMSFPWVSSLDAPKDIIDKTLDINLKAAVNVTQVIGRKMVESVKGGSIVNVSSINGLNPMRECMAYNMSKAALDMMSKQFALELGPYKIRVNSVNPTVVLTDMGREF